jgi:hypothetical protein
MSKILGTAMRSALGASPVTAATRRSQETKPTCCSRRGAAALRTAPDSDNNKGECCRALKLDRFSKTTKR